MKKILRTLIIIITIPFLTFVGMYIYGVYFFEADPATQAYLDEKNPKKKMLLLDNILNEDEYTRWAWLDDAAVLAYEIEEYDKAKTYSLESLSISSRYKDDWNYGNSIHNANTVLGRLSLIEGDTEKAKVYLLEAAKSKGSPQLDTFGPKLELAQELLIIEERDVVLSYLKSISKFWEMDDGCINRWIEKIDNNETPKLCSCNC